MAHAHVGNALQSNFDVDYVIAYRFLDTNQGQAGEKFTQLIKLLSQTGLATEVRNGQNCSLLVFVKPASDKVLNSHIYRSRVKDWLYGVRAAQPDREAHNTLTREPPTQGERYRIIYHMITSPKEEGGAGITPKQGQWKEVESVFPLHDQKFNKEWIKKWSQATFLKPEDLDEIRDRLGEKVAFYFSFTQSYFAFLMFPAAFGFSAWVLLGSFSPVYAIVNGLWCITFIEYWKHQEVDLSIQWSVKGVSAMSQKRKGFAAEKKIKDPVTGEMVEYFPGTTRLSRQLLQIPFALLAALALGTLIASCFAVEIFLSEVYDGPMKSVLVGSLQLHQGLLLMHPQVFLPTGILTTMVPTLTTLLTTIATQLTDYENWDTVESYESAMTQKIFILNFITSYLPIFLTAFVYVPLGSLIVPYLDIFSLTARPFAESETQLQTPKAGFVINPERLRKQVIYFTVTAQAVNFAMETLLPWVKRQGFRKYVEHKSASAAKSSGTRPEVHIEDIEEETVFLTKVRNEAELDVYDVTSDLREMVVQFGYLTLFSVVWPLTPLSFIINNWIELRADAVKICVEMQRPNPIRAESIGPWLDSLSFLTWLGSITSAALVYMFSDGGMGPGGTPSQIKGWALLLTIFLSEHIYLALRMAIRLAISKLDSPGLQKERAEKFSVRKRYLEETLDVDSTVLPPPHAQEKITRASLEEEARQGSLHSTSPEVRFWRRQRTWEESAMVGTGLIKKMAPGESKKQQ